LSSFWKVIAISAKIRVLDAPANSPHKGKCAVIVRQELMSPIKAEWGSDEIPATSQGQRWQKYLTQEALALIRPNDNPEGSDLLLAQDFLSSTIRS
jgi:hypothetical protein